MMNRLRSCLFPSMAVSLVIAGCALLEKAPPAKSPLIVTNHQTIRAWPGDSGQYVGSKFALTIETNIFDALTIMEDNQLLSSYRHTAPPNTSGYAPESESTDPAAGTKRAENSIYIGNLQNRNDCDAINYTFRATSPNPAYRNQPGQPAEIARRVVFIRDEPEILDFALQEQPLEVSYSARAKTAELLVEYPNGTVQVEDTFTNPGCGATMTRMVPLTLSGGGVLILRVENEIGTVREQRFTVAAAQITSGTGEVCLSRHGNTAGVYQVVQPEPPGGTSCPAVITRVISPSPSFIVWDGDIASDFCRMENDLAMSHTDLSNPPLDRQIDSIPCGQESNLFNGQTVAGMWTSNFAVSPNSGPPPYTVCFEVEWDNPDSC